MNILMVIDSLGSGGTQRQFVNIANGLAATHTVTTFLYNANSDFYRNDLRENIPVICAKRSAKKGFSASVICALVGHMCRADVVMSFLPTANIYCSMAGIFAPGKCHISCERSVINVTESKGRRFLANLANWMSSHVVCNSHTQAAYVTSLPGMRRKVFTIWNGCKDLSFTPRPAVDPHAHSIIVVGRIAYPKNGMRLLQALDIFHKKNGFLPRVSWAGRDDNSDPRSIETKRQMMEFLEAHPHVNARFHFLGEVSHVDSLYAQSDTLLAPSIYEGLPNVICEAMLSGCPVIASKVSDNAIILGEKEERGFLCDPLSPDDICAAMERRLSTSPEALAEMVSRARAFAAREFSIDKMVTQYNRIIKLAA